MCHRASIYPQPPHILFPFSVFFATRRRRRVSASSLSLFPLGKEEEEEEEEEEATSHRQLFFLPRSGGVKRLWSPVQISPYICILFPCVSLQVPSLFVRQKWVTFAQKSCWIPSPLRPLVSRADRWLFSAPLFVVASPSPSFVGRLGRGGTKRESLLNEPPRWIISFPPS